MATYNCTDSTSSAYGAGGYGTCESVGAPNTGFFQQIVDGGTFTILAPLAVAIVAVLIASIVVRWRRKSPE